MATGAQRARTASGSTSHKFRHTFATEHLRHGIDVRTLQGWMGHRDIQSTMVYLKGIQSKDALEKVNAGSLAAYVASRSRTQTVLQTLLL
jgi:site-specific recombinase XerD